MNEQMKCLVFSGTLMGAEGFHIQPYVFFPIAGFLLNYYFFLLTFLMLCHSRIYKKVVKMIQRFSINSSLRFLRFISKQLKCAFPFKVKGIFFCNYGTISKIRKLTLYYYLTDGPYSNFASYSFYLLRIQSGITYCFLLCIWLAFLRCFSVPWSLYFINLRFLSASQLFCRMFFNLGFSDVLS